MTHGLSYVRPIVTNIVRVWQILSPRTDRRPCKSLIVGHVTPVMDGEASPAADPLSGVSKQTISTLVSWFRHSLVLGLRVLWLHLHVAYCQFRD